MTSDVSQRAAGSEESLLWAIGTILLRRRAWLIRGSTGGAILGLVVALFSAPRYTSNAVFLPEATDGAESGLAAAASQFGIQVPSTGSAWTPGLFASVLQTRTILEPVVRESLPDPEVSGKMTTLVELFDVGGATEGQRVDNAMRLLREKVAIVSQDNLLGVVGVRVTTKWPAVSHKIASDMVALAQHFNVAVRQSLGGAERQFAEQQAAEAEANLRAAEDQLQAFLVENRSIEGSARLQFARDRLQREVAIRQQVFTTLVQGREEARLREVRNTPVVSLIEAPQLPLTFDPRRRVLKVLVGMIVGLLLSMGGILATEWWRSQRHRNDGDVGAFFRALRVAVPIQLRRLLFDTSDAA